MVDLKQVFSGLSTFKSGYFNENLKLFRPQFTVKNRTNTGHDYFFAYLFFLFFDSCLPLRPQKN